MTEGGSETGLSVARGEQVLSLTAAQLGVRNLGTSPMELPGAKDQIYRSNQELWHALIDARIRATAVVRLEDFWLSEWFPLRPGLFHTPRGRQSRSMAKRFVITGPGASADGLRQFENRFGRVVSSEVLERIQFESTFVYDPYGKTFMLDGGVGCIRLKCKEIPAAGRVWFMGASSTPVAHEGVPVALPNGLYEEIIDYIAANGSLQCTITGRLAQIPIDFDPLYRDLVGIPQLYVLAERLEPLRPASGTPFLSTGAVMIETESGGKPPEGTWDLVGGIYAAYVSFSPGRPNTIRMAAEWLEDIYVHELLDGRVLTDFDEQVRRFAGTTFGLEEVMGGRISTVDTNRLLRRCGASQPETDQFIHKIEIVNGDTWNIGGNAQVVVNRGFVQRAKESRWPKFFGAIALAATVAATILLILNVADIAIAGYIVAVIAIVIGVIPLYSK